MTTLVEELAANPTTALVERLVDDGVAESETLEFKGGRYQGSEAGGWGPAQEFAKDVAALANHRGGVLVIGIRDKARIADELAPIVDVDAEGEQRRLRQWLARYTAPVVEADVRDVPATGGSGYYLVVVVPRSPHQPHAVLADNSRRPLIYPVRDGQDTRYLNEHEVARRYADRLQGQVERRELFEGLISEGVSSLDRSSSIWMWLALRPEFPLNRELDTATANAISDWWHSLPLLNGPFGSLLWARNAIVGRGFVSFTSHKFRDEDDEADPRDSYVELHADGSSFVAIDLNVRTSDDNQLGHVGYFTVIDGMIPMVDVGARWAAETVGGTGMANVAVGLADTTGEKIPLEMVSDEGSRELRRLGATRVLRGDLIVSRDHTVADVAACADVQGRLALVHACLSPLLQRFGRPESDQITRDGRVAWRAWKRFPDVKRWAEAAGLPTDEGLGPSLRL